jgi:hypothetical protein
MYWNGFWRKAHTQTRARVTQNPTETKMLGTGAIKTRW